MILLDSMSPQLRSGQAERVHVLAVSGCIQADLVKAAAAIGLRTALLRANKGTCDPV